MIERAVHRAISAAERPHSKAVRSRSKFVTGESDEALKRERENPDGERAQPPPGAMSRRGAQDLGVGPHALGEGAGAEEDGKDVGEGECEEEPPQAWGRIDFEPQAAHAEMGLPVAEGQLDVHPLAVEVDDFVDGQLRRGVGGNQEEPRLLERGVVEDDEIDRFLRGVLIGDIGVAPGAAGPTGQAAEAASLAADSHDRIAPAAEDEGEVRAACRNTRTVATRVQAKSARRLRTPHADLSARGSGLGKLGSGKGLRLDC